MPADTPLNPCHRCGEKTATNYICHTGSEPTIDLCDDCLKAEDPRTESFILEMKSATCRFCGSSPCTGGTDTLAQLTSAPQQHLWMCPPCAQEYHITTARLLKHIPSGLTREEQVEKIKEISHQLQAHMQHFISNRKN